MLSAAEILKRVQEEGAGHLAIIPSVEEALKSEKSATSVDMRLGRWFRSFKQTHTPSCSLAPTALSSSTHQRDLPTKQHYIPFGKKFVVHPGGFVLGATLEWLSLPSNMAGYVTGKSTLGRHGLVIETASGIHPGFSGCLTLELANVGEIPLEIWPGMEICQVFFHEIEGIEATDKGVASGYRKPALPDQREDGAFERLLESYKLQDSSISG